MNCKHIYRILDEGDLLSLSRQERDRVEAHLDDCPGCRDEWHAQRLLAEVLVPPTPAGLLDRICEAIDRFVAGNVIPFPARRTIIITGIVLIASAAATMIAIELDDDRAAVVEQTTLEPEQSTTAPPGADDAPPVPAADPLIALTAPAAGDGEPDAGVSEPEANGAADADPAAPAPLPPPSDTIALDRATVLILPVDNNTTSQALAQLAVQFRDRFEARLRTEPGLNVVESNLVPDYRSSSGMDDREVAQMFGAAIVVGFSTIEEEQTDNATIRYEIYDAQADRVLVSGGMGADSLPWDLNPPFAVPERLRRDPFETQISQIRQHALGEADPRAPDEPSALLATAYDPNARPMARGSAVNNLMFLAQSRGTVSTEQVIDAALAVATTASFVLDLEQAWRVLRRLEAPAEHAPAAIAALSTEQNERVRIEIVRFLRAHSELSSVRNELERIVALDEFEAVRDEAAFALLSEDERLELKRDTFLDLSLSIEERMEVFGYSDDIRPVIDEEIAEALIEIATEAQDMGQRSNALYALSDADLPSLINPLLEFVESDDERDLRVAAIVALRPYKDEPRVRDVLTALSEDDDRDIRSTARSVLDQ